MGPGKGTDESKDSSTQGYEMLSLGFFEGCSKSASDFQGLKSLSGLGRLDEGLWREKAEGHGGSKE